MGVPADGEQSCFFAVQSFSLPYVRKLALFLLLQVHSHSFFKAPISSPIFITGIFAIASFFADSAVSVLLNKKKKILFVKDQGWLLVSQEFDMSISPRPPAEAVSPPATKLG